MQFRMNEYTEICTVTVYTIMYYNTVQHEVIFSQLDKEKKEFQSLDVL